MPLDPKGRLLTIRIQSDWDHDTAPVFHIERIGAEGVSRPRLSAGFVSRALDRSAAWIEKTAVFWNAYIYQKEIEQRSEGTLPDAQFIDVQF